MTPRAKPTSCAGCALLGHGTDFSAIEGTGSSGVMLVGEASGEHEQRDQLPFRPFAPAGGVLERTLRRMSIDRQMLSVTNCIRCRPRNNWLENSPHEYSALNHCRPNLDAAIAERRPRAIVALGGIATRELTGLAGEKLGVSYLAGYVLPGPQQIPVIPDFHPAFLRRGKASYQGVFGRILRRAMRVAAGQDRDYRWNVNPEDPSYVHAQRYTLRPTVSDCWEYSRHVCGNPRDVLSYDIETNESVSLDEDAREGFADTHIRLVQFASESAGAIAIPWQREFYGAIQSLLHSPNPKCGHNVWLFDNNVLRAASAREGEDFAPRGVIHDTLAMFHHWQPDLPAHLQFAAGFVSFPFPWKHLAASDIEFYGCCDVDATLRLHRMLEATLRRDGLCGDDCTGYIGQVYQVRPVLAAMELRGMPIDDTERRKLDQEFSVAQTALGEELAREAPPACGRVQPKSGYKGIPPEVKKFELHHDALKERFFDATSEEYYRYEMREFAVPVVDSATGAPVVHPTLRWCRVYEFNPNSRDQVKAYMVAKRHPVPKDKHREDENGESPDTTAAKELIRLSNKTGDLFYRKVVEYRGLTKMRGTYVEGFKPHEDGCVHTSFTFDTGIGQLSCCASWTRIKTKRGHIPIDYVRVGDLVWTHRSRWRRVTHVWSYPAKPMVEVHFSNGEVLTCTDSHRLLSCGHEHKQELDDFRERSASVGHVPQRRSSYSGIHISEIGYWDSHCDLDIVPSNVIGGIWSIKKAPLFTCQERDQKSLVRETRAGHTELGRVGEGWLRVSDLSSEWEASICPSLCDGSGVRFEVSTEEVRGASYQRRHRGQSLEQSSSSNERRSQVHSLVAANGSQIIKVEKVIPVGCFPVYDITVDEDESYECCGVFSHNSRNPNIQNFPKLKPTPELAKAMRKMVAAQPGKIITEWDFKSCHVLTLGFLAEDANYIRLARLDMHSFVTGHVLGLWDGPTIMKESDDELRARFKWLKSDADRKRVRDDQAKHTILGVGNGLMPKGMYERYMENFPPQKCKLCAGTGQVPGVRALKRCTGCKGMGFISGLTVAETFHQALQKLFPKVFAWQKHIQKVAHEQQYLRTEFGHIRRFYEVFRWDPRRHDWGHGDQAEEAIAFWLANIAFGHIREKLKQLDAAGLAEKYGLFNNVHDSFLFHFDERLLEEHVREVHPVLVSPSSVLRHPTIAPAGLVIDVEGAAGRNWADMTEIDTKQYLQRDPAVAV